MWDFSASTVCISFCNLCTTRLSKHTHWPRSDKNGLHLRTRVPRLQRWSLLGASDWRPQLRSKDMAAFEVVIYNFFLFPVGCRSSILYHLFHLPYSRGAVVSSSHLSPPTHPPIYKCIYLSSMCNSYLYRWIPLSSALLFFNSHTHTHIYWPPSLPPAPPISFSLHFSCSVCFASAQ